MSHLGSRISALVDGQLTPAATERALAHVAGCPECAAELSAARAARAALASATDDVSPDADFAARLLSLAPMQPPAVAPRSTDPFAPPPRRTSHDVASYGLHRGRARRVWDAQTGAALCGEVPMRRVTSRLVVGSVAGMGAVAVMLFVLGERPAMAPEGQLSADLELLGHATAQPVSDEIQTVSDDDEPESWLASNGWPFPAELPAGWDVTDVRYTDEGAVEVDVTSPAGPVVVTEQAGRLDTARLVGAEQVTLDGRDVALLSREPWHVVWQSGATVVQVVAAQQSDGVTELVAGFPGGAFDDGVPARISRGWSTVTGVFDQP
ncbi:zf-HC2 domain-containing protein [Cellulomonas rhizosphaerae]|uniref:Zf-HC2 domain-containing protein n=1 Tax=Cellulomonas rhizosphaerae TaxID=2293719 RepID=A0A413RKH9_9CELL|nr:zf-HC2 domain-containing protein [Cellulomonas rhizosphaerae]RHA39649.1 zf-HC2 domain-containing protein [Cellulomonas rhizosphaerae]